MTLSAEDAERAHLAGYAFALERWRASGSNTDFQAAIRWLAGAYRLALSRPPSAKREALEAVIKAEAAALEALIPHAARDREPVARA